MNLVTFGKQWLREKAHESKQKSNKSENSIEMSSSEHSAVFELLKESVCFDYTAIIANICVTLSFVLNATISVQIDLDGENVDKLKNIQFSSK